MPDQQIPVPDFSGWGHGVYTVLSSFGDMINDIFESDVVGTIVEFLGFAIVIVFVWYGLRAILRAVRTPK